VALMKQGEQVELLLLVDLIVFLTFVAFFDAWHERGLSAVTLK